jgi:hypothetical protein
MPFGDEHAFVPVVLSGLSGGTIIPSMIGRAAAACFYWRLEACEGTEQ